MTTLLVTFALLVSGEGPQRPQLAKVIKWLQTLAIPLASTDPIIPGRRLKGGYDNRHVRYRRFAVLDMTVRHRPRLAACFVKDRPTVIFSYEDLTLGAMGVARWGILGYTQPSATQLLTNVGPIGS